jgi:hypothetical protein
MVGTPQGLRLFVSQAVILEAGRGDSSAAMRRLAAIEGVAVLEVTEDATTLAEAFLEQRALPPKAALDGSTSPLP